MPSPHPITPTRAEWRVAIRYVRAQFRIMWPTRKPHRVPRYRETVIACVRPAVALRVARG